MCVARLQPLLQQPRPTITTTAATRIHLLSSRSFSQPTSPAFCLLPSSPSCSPILGQTTKLTALQVQLVSAAAAFNYDIHLPPPPPPSHRLPAALLHTCTVNNLSQRAQLPHQVPISTLQLHSVSILFLFCSFCSCGILFLFRRCFELFCVVV